MNPWIELPSGRDVAMEALHYYAVVASLAKNYDEQRVKDEMSKRGLELLDWGEQGDPARPGLGPDPDTSHRYVAVTAFANQKTSIPWAPGFLWIHPFHLVRAWEAPPAPADPTVGPTPGHVLPQPPPPPPPRPRSKVPFVLGALGLLAFVARRRRR